MSNKRIWFVMLAMVFVTSSHSAGTITIEENTDAQSN